MSMAKDEYDMYDIFENGDGGLKKTDIRGTWDGDGCWLFADGSALTWTEPEGRNLGSDDDYFMTHLCVEPGIAQTEKEFRTIFQNISLTPLT